MRLTQTLKNKFINAVLNDTDSEDSLLEAMRGIIQQDAYEQLPEKIKEIYDDEDLRDNYLQTRYVKNTSFNLGGDFITPIDYELKNPEKISQLKTLSTLRFEKRRNIYNLRIELNAELRKFNTIQQFVRAFPMFGKYFTKEELGTSFKETYSVPKLEENSPTLFKLLNSVGWPKKEVEKEILPVKIEPKTISIDEVPF